MSFANFVLRSLLCPPQLSLSSAALFVTPKWNEGVSGVSSEGGEQMAESRNK